MTIPGFTYEALPGRVVFGRGTLSQLADEVNQAGAARALVITTAPQAGTANTIAKSLGDLAIGSYPKAVMHSPVQVTDEAMVYLQEAKVDCLVAVGGGSAIGLAKALAYRTELPQIAIPTTYAGSEMTPILGQTEDGLKTTVRSSSILPETVLYDVDLTLTLPKAMSITSGLNAMAHAVEALYAENRNPVISMMAEEGIRSLFRALPAIHADPSDTDARTQALYGAWLCGAALGSVGMALHHKLCHTVGGTWNLPHAETHTIILPHATAFNAQACERLDALGREIAGQSLATALYDLAQSCGVPLALKDIGMPEDGLARAAQLAVARPYYNPKPFTETHIAKLLDDAFHGRRPGGN